MGPRVDYTKLYNHGTKQKQKGPCIENTNEYDIDIVCLSGAGVRGIAYLGLLKALSERQLLKSIDYWIGSSAGALCSALVVFGADVSSISKVFAETDFSTIIDNNLTTGVPSWWNKASMYTELFNNLGSMRGDNFIQWLVTIMKAFNIDPNITFGELYEKTGKTLCVSAFSVNTSETIYISRLSYPKFRVIDALKATMSIPYVFQPAHMKDPCVPEGPRLLSDGGTLDNYPINICDIVGDKGDLIAYNRRVIGAFPVSNGKWNDGYIKIESLYSYSAALLHSLHKKIHTELSKQEYFWERSIPIETGSVEATNFNLSDEEKHFLIESGYASTSKFLNKRKEMITKKGNLPSNIFIPACGQTNKFPNTSVSKTKLFCTNPEKFRDCDIKVPEELLEHNEPKFYN